MISSTVAGTPGGEIYTWGRSNRCKPWRGKLKLSFQLPRIFSMALFESSREILLADFPVSHSPKNLF